MAAASGFQGSRAAGVSGEFPRRRWSWLQPWHLSAPPHSGFAEGFSAAELPFVLFCILRLPESSVGHRKLPTIYIFFSFGQRKSVSVLGDRNLSNHLTESSSPWTFYFLLCINHFGQLFYQFGTWSSSSLLFSGFYDLRPITSGVRLREDPVVRVRLSICHTGIWGLPGTEPRTQSSRWLSTSERLMSPMCRYISTPNSALGAWEVKLL